MRGWVVSGLQFTGLQFTRRQASVRYALDGEKYSTLASTIYVRDVTAISVVSRINDMPIVQGGWSYVIRSISAATTSRDKHVVNGIITIDTEVTRPY